MLLLTKDQKPPKSESLNIQSLRFSKPIIKSSEELTYYPLPGFGHKKIVLEGKKNCESEHRDLVKHLLSF